jgi:hypothetical protein
MSGMVSLESHAGGSHSSSCEKAVHLPVSARKAVASYVRANRSNTLLNKPMPVV